MSVEEWRPVTGYEGSYEVSDSGRVRALARVIQLANGSRRRQAGRYLSPKRTANGHLWISLYLDGAHVRKQVHRLVLETFVGPCPDGMLGCHYDDDPSNNHVSNLRWATRMENSLDATRNGRNRNALKTHCPKGHPYDEQNTKRGSRQAGRQCRTCNTESNAPRLRARRLRLKEAAS